jgi:ABC-type glycerol-3-phosphate transport system permease component
MADEPEREVIVTNNGGGGGGGVIAAILLLIIVVVVLFFVFGRGMLGGGADKIEADVKVDTPAN